MELGVLIVLNKAFNDARRTTTAHSLGNAIIKPAVQSRDTMDVEKRIIDGESISFPYGCEAHTAKPESVSCTEIRRLKTGLHETGENASVCMASLIPPLERG